VAKYRVVIRKEAEAEFLAIPFPFRRQINQRIFKLKDDPRPPESIPDEQAEQYRRLDYSGWQILYSIDDEKGEITIFAFAAVS